jgi:hypothetical protein
VKCGKVLSGERDWGLHFERGGYKESVESGEWGVKCGKVLSGEGDWGLHFERGGCKESVGSGE